MVHIKPQKNMKPFKHFHGDQTQRVSQQATFFPPAFRPKQPPVD